ncbi:MAG: hypothetical protein U0936_22120 [Planctomycetaceae bacterium]
MELFEHCVLRPLRAVNPDALKRGYIVQDLYQEQHKRVLEHNGRVFEASNDLGERYDVLTPKDRLRIMFVANCRPVCYRTSRKTTFCGMPLVCPWCFVRERLVPASKWLTEVLPLIANTHCLLQWDRDLPDIYADPQKLFFRPNHGPSRSFSALRYLQVAKIMHHMDQGFYWRCSGYALIPKISLEKVRAKLWGRYGGINAELHAADEPLTATAIHKCFFDTFTFPLALLARENLEIFIYLYRGRRHGVKLYRQGGRKLQVDVVSGPTST